MGFAIKNVNFLGCWSLYRMFYRDEYADPQGRGRGGEDWGVEGALCGVGQLARSGVPLGLILVPAFLGPTAAGPVAHC